MSISFLGAYPFLLGAATKEKVNAGYHFADGACDVTD